MAQCCEVALPVPLDRVFTYAVPDGQHPQRGARVVAPFRNERLIGVVTAVGVPTPPDFEVRFLDAVLDLEPLLSEQLLTLAEWMAHTPHLLMNQHLGVGMSMLDGISKQEAVVTP